MINEKLRKEVSNHEIRNTEELKLKKALQMEKKASEQMKVQLDALRVSNGVLERRVGKLEHDRNDLGRKIRMNEEDIDYLVEVNKPLEKAYKSLQRKYQITRDELERKEKSK